MKHAFFHVIHQIQWAGTAQSVQRLATGWMVQGSNPDEGKIFHTCPYWPWGPPSGYRIFPQVKAAEVWSSPPTPI